MIFSKDFDLFSAIQKVRLSEKTSEILGQVSEKMKLESLAGLFGSSVVRWFGILVVCQFRCLVFRWFSNQMSRVLLTYRIIEVTETGGDLPGIWTNPIR